MKSSRYSIHSDPENIPVVHSKWYPPVAVTEKNLDYARILIPDFASAASEMTTVHQYLFQSWTMGEEHKTIRRVIQRMAKVEQHHFAILGQLISLLGCLPECRTQIQSSYWCGDMVNYTCDPIQVLAENAKSEEFAARTYAAQSEEIKDPRISRMLARLSQDEKLHHKIFSDFLSQIEP